MSTTGYSGTPLLKKLGIQPGMKVWLINQPPDYPHLLEKDISNQVIKKNETADLVHLFAKNKKEFEAAMRQIKPAIVQNNDIVIWVSWYKKSAGVTTDITENDIRSYALQNGLVDIKVCAVSALWSGLKLVVPVALRSKK